MDGTEKYWTSMRIHGKRYALVVVAPEGRGLFVEFTKRKKQFPGVFRRKRRVWQQKAGVLIKYLRLDRAGEHIAKRFRKFLDRKGIVASYTATNSSAGPAEAYIHICQDAMVSMLEHYHEMHGKRANDKWEYAFRYACDTKSMTWCTTKDGESMYEKQTGKAPPLDKCHVWGVTVTAHQSDKTQRLKGANASWTKR